MSKGYLLTVVVFVLSINISYSQFREFDIDSINFNNKKTTKIFVTALWCSPCVGKYKKIVSVFETDTISNNIVLFDVSSFSVSKLSKIEQNYYDSLKSFLIPYKYYNSTGPVVFNLSKKVLKRFISALKIKFPKHDNLDSFWYGDILKISPQGVLTIEKVTL